MNGSELITQERRNQTESHEWSNEHDDEMTGGDLAVFGAAYALDAVSNYSSYSDGMKERYKNAAELVYPFDEEWWHPTPDNPIRQLVKAGALIAAEIDRLQRAKKELDI